MRHRQLLPKIFRPITLPSERVRVLCGWRHRLSPGLSCLLIFIVGMRDKSGSDTLYLVQSRISSRKDGGVIRLYSYNLYMGILFFNPSATPLKVPPVPTPATKMSTFPSVSFHISCAVVRAWAAGFAGFSNCPKMTAPGVRSRNSSAFLWLLSFLLHLRSVPIVLPWLLTGSGVPRSWFRAWSVWLCNLSRWQPMLTLRRCCRWLVQ